MLNDDTKQNDSYFIFSFLQKIRLEYLSEMRCNLNKIKNMSEFVNVSRPLQANIVSYWSSNSIGVNIKAEMVVGATCDSHNCACLVPMFVDIGLLFLI
jgi:hypothetical protein